MFRKNAVRGGLLVALFLAGCSSQDADQSTVSHSAPVSSGPSAEGARYLLASAPARAQDVIAMRESAADGEDVVVVGRIGGDVNPWINGRAAFLLVDSSLQACSDIPGDACETPWDYCCQTDKLPGAKVLVKFTGDDGQLLAADARALLGVSELQTVVVQGKARKDETGSVSVLASAIYIQPGGTSRGPGAAHAHEDGEHDAHGGGHDGHADHDAVSEPAAGHDHEANGDHAAGQSKAATGN